MALASAASGGLERRLVLRLIGHWMDVRGERAIPARSDLDDDLFGDTGPERFLLEAGRGGAFRIAYASPSLRAQWGGDLIGRTRDKIPRHTPLGCALGLTGAVLARRVPLSVADRLRTEDGAETLVRACLMPLSDDGAVVDALFGAISSHVVQRRSTAKQLAELTGEI